MSLAVLPIIRFALHNASEGFAIVGPLAAAKVRPSRAKPLPVGRLSCEVTLWGPLAGFLLGVAKDLILVAAGG